MGQLDLALFVGEQKSFRPLQNAEAPALKTGGVFSAANAFATSFNSDHSNMSIVQKRMEQANGVAAAADTGDEQIWQTTFAFENLMARLNANDALKIADHHGVRVGAENRAQYIMSGAHVRDPVAHRFVDRFLERGLPSCDRNNFRAEKFHARDVERLAFHIDPAHVNHALAPEASGDGGSSNAMLAGTCLGDDAALAHSLRQQNLSEGIVDFVRAGVEQVFALQINFRARELVGIAFSEIERRRSAGVIA